MVAQEGVSFYEAKKRIMELEKLQEIRPVVSYAEVVSYGRDNIENQQVRQ